MDIKSESFIHRSKIPAIEREQMPIVLTYLNEIVAIGELYVHEQFKDLITIKMMEMNDNA